MRVFTYARPLAFAAALGIAALDTVPALATPVGTELQLMIDASGSISRSEYAQQIAIYGNAFGRLRAAEAAGLIDLGTFAVQASVWSAAGVQAPLFDWLLIDDDTDYAQASFAFSAALQRPIPIPSTTTSVESALAFAVDSFTNNGFDGARQVIDISTDRLPNEGATSNEGGQIPTTDDLGFSLGFARNEALRSEDPITIGGFTFPGGGGIEQINVLLINADTATETFYEDSLVGGDDAFLVSLNTNQTTADEIAFLGNGLARKIAAEVLGTDPDDVPTLPEAPAAVVPLPAALWLLLAGIGGLGVVRHTARRT